MKRTIRLVAALLPALLVVVGLFAGGLGVAIGQSLGMWSGEGLTLGHYAALGGDGEFLRSLGLTLGLGLVATGISAVGGGVLALALWRRVARRGWVGGLMQVPLAIPHLSMAVVLLNVISPSGLVARVAFWLGVIEAPEGFPAMVGDAWGVGILLAYLLKEVPFVALMLVTLLLRTGDGYEEVARTLGAGWWQRVWRVWVPLMAPAAVSSSLMVFAFILGAYEVPALLGRPYPALLAVVAQRRYLDTDLSVRPGAIALAVVLSLITVVLVWGYLRLARRGGESERPILF